jgi:hypothetical protein
MICGGHGALEKVPTYAEMSATAAAMKRIPRTPSAMPGTSSLAGSGSRLSSRAWICSATSQ